MKIWIIYDAERYQKNAVFAKKLKEAFKKRNQIAEIIIFDDFSTLPFPLPDIAIMRMVHPLLTEFLIENGVYVQNNAFVSQITNDKYKTYQYLSPFVDMAKSYLIDDSCLDFPLPFPFILKSLDGHGGQEVFYVQNKNEVHQAFLQTNKKQMLAQEIIPELGKDLRVYVLHDQIICAMLRTSFTDFRSNFSLGGQAQIYHLNDKEKQIVYEVIRHFDFGLVGIDFLFKNNQLILNEIEDVVGCRMVYTYTDIDIAQLYIDYILKDFYSKK